MSTNVEEVKDSILEKITLKLEHGSSDSFTQVEKLAAAYRQLADARRLTDQ